MVLGTFDKNSLYGVLKIPKTELAVKQGRPQDMKEDFRPVLQVTITKWNLESWSKSVRQRFQEVTLGRR
jgi:hypothetical protein